MTSGYVQLGDVHAYYEDDGAGDPLVLLHPGLADSRAFERSVPGLAERFRVYFAREPDLCNRIVIDFLTEREEQP